jgi:two-component system, chemotaxis family, chemotaxis protein CheY
MGKTVLIVDDSQVFRASTKFFLERAGFLVAEACDGAEGLRMLGMLERTGAKPSMILTDINMPRMDGIAFVKEVKKGSHRFTPILVVTTESQSDKKMEGKAAGATGWLVKPFEESQLLAVVRKFVR